MLAYRRLLLVPSLGLACIAAPASNTTDEPASTGSPTTGDSTASPTTTSTAGVTTGAPDTGATTSTSSGTSTGDTEDPPGPLLDLSVPDAPKLPPRTPPWLVHMGNVDSERHLFHIDIDTAAATDVCTVVDTGTMLPYSGGSPSVTFTRDDRLLFSTGSVLYEIELPSCMATQLGSIGFTGVNGICPDEGNDLYGLSTTSDILMRIDAQTGVGTQVGALGSNWGQLGGTWNEDLQQILGIDSMSDSLYEIDAMTGMAILQQALPLDFTTVGVEFHPLTGQVYTCTGDSHLYRLEMDGSLTDLGDMGFTGCTNLGAPWSEVVELPTPG